MIPVSARIHKTAVIDPTAEIDSSVAVGAYSVIGAHVTIGSGTRIKPHVVIDDYTSIGCNNQFFQFSSVGAIPQDKKYSGKGARLIIGNDNIIREYCTINAGADPATVIGNDNWFMAYVHIAHDCQIGNYVVFVNASTLAGHVEVGDHATVGATTKVHQQCRIGAYSFSRDAVLTQDLPPYIIGVGTPVKAYGLNKVALIRNGFDQELIDVLGRTYKRLIKRPVTDEDIAAVKVDVEKYPEVRIFFEFIEASKNGRGYIR